MENAPYFQNADDNSFSGAFADIYLQNPHNLQQVEAESIQDEHYNNFQQNFPSNEPQSFLQMMPPPPAVADDENTKDPNDDLELNPDQIDDIECNQFAPKTKKQTNWGVKKFRGIYFMHKN